MVGLGERTRVIGNMRAETVSSVSIICPVPSVSSLKGTGVSSDYLEGLNQVSAAC